MARQETPRREARSKTQAAARGHFTVPLPERLPRGGGNDAVFLVPQPMVVHSARSGRLPQAKDLHQVVDGHGELGHAGQDWRGDR